MEQLGTAVLDLAVDQSQLKSGLAGTRSQVESEVRSLGQKAKSTGAALTKTLTPVAAGLGLAFKKAFEEWDGGVDAIRVGTGATGKELDKLTASMKNVASKVTQPLSQVGQVMADLATRTGLTGKPLEDLTTQVLNLARITGEDAQASIAGLTRMYGDWGIKTKDMVPTLDKLFRTSQATGIGVQQLSELMVQFGSPLRNLGLDFDTSAAMFAKFEKEGVNIQTVMPGLKMALKNFASAGREPSEALQETFKAMQNAGSESELMSLAFETFGARAGPDLAAAVREGRFDFEELIDTMNNGSDTIEKATKDTTDLSDKMAMFRNKVTAIIGPFGEMGSVIMGAVASVGPALFGFGVIAESSFGKVIGGWIKAKAEAVKATAVTVKNAAIQAARWAWLGVQSLAHAAKVALAWMIAMGPIALVVAAVVGLVVLIVKNFDTIKEVISKAWEWIKDQSSRAWDAIKDFFARWWPLLLAVFTGGMSLVAKWVFDNWDRIKERTKAVFSAIREFLASIWNAIKEKAAAVWEAIVEFLKQRLENVKNNFINIFTGIRDLVANVWERIRELVGNAISAVRERIGNALEAIRERWGNAWEAVREKVAGAWDRIKTAVGNGIERLLDWFKNLPGRVVNALGNLGKLLWNVGKDMIGGLIGGIKEAAKSIGSAIGGAVSGAVSALNPFGGGVGAGDLGGGLVPLGHSLQSQGFRVGGHPNFGGVTQGAHSAGSYHYVNRAIDINWGAGGTSAEEMSVLTGLGMKLKAVYGSRLKELLGPWNDVNHKDHLHIAMANGAVVTRPTLGLIGETAAARPEIVTPERLMRQIVREEGGAGDTFNIDQIVLPNIRGAVMAEEFFDNLRQTVRQGV